MSNKVITVKVNGRKVADFPVGEGGDRRGFDSTGYRAARDWASTHYRTGRIEIHGPRGQIVAFGSR